MHRYSYNSGPYTVTIPANPAVKNGVTTITNYDICEMSVSETFNLIINPSSLPNGVTSSNNAIVAILDLYYSTVYLLHVIVTAIHIYYYTHILQEGMIILLDYIYNFLPE